MLTRPWVPIGSTEQAHLDEAEEVAATHLGAPDDYVRRVRLAGQHRAHLADVLLSFAKTSSRSVDDGRCSRRQAKERSETIDRRGGPQVRRATTER
jgi:succinylarginine dihydrolase